MGRFHKLAGLECPTCQTPLPLSASSVLLGDETISAPLGTITCSNCNTEIRAKGTRFDHFVRLGTVYILPAFFVFHIWGIGPAVVLNLLLLPFVLRFVGVERA